MDSLLNVPTDVGVVPSSPDIINQSKAHADSAAIEAISLSKKNPTDKVEVAFDDLYKGLTITAGQIIEKLNELLAQDLPDGIESLNPVDHTAEKTAERIVSGATGLFGIFSQQNPDLENDELLSRFMDTIRGGITKGYDEAFSILEGLGAFEFDGVQGGIEQTKGLIEEKLIQFEETMKKELGLSTDTTMEEQVAAPVKNHVLAQGSGSLLSVTA